MSEVINYTDASPTGGATAIATRFKKGEVKVPSSQVLKENCAVCGTPFAEVRGCGKYPCSRNYGERMCSVMCCHSHQEESCSRGDLWPLLFGERFAGRNFSLTKACALVGVGMQAPLDREGPSLRWEFFSPEGKQKLDSFENGAGLAASHWTPEGKTFSAARGRPIVLSSGRRVTGPKALRSRKHPWGLRSITKNEQIKVRQGNSMAKRAILGCKDAFLCRRFASLEHPWASHLWHTDEAKELCEMEGVYVILAIRTAAMEAEGRSGNLWSTIARTSIWSCINHIALAMKGFWSIRFMNKVTDHFLLTQKVRLSTHGNGAWLMPVD